MYHVTEADNTTRASCPRAPTQPLVAIAVALATTAMMNPPIATHNLAAPITALAACPVPEPSSSEHLIAAGGTDHLSLVAARPPNHLSQKPIALNHAGPLDALAWGHDANAVEHHLAAFSAGTFTLHRFRAGGAGDSISTATELDASMRARSACFLQQPGKLALTGDGCACVVVTLDGSANTDANTRRIPLASPGVSVRAHAREPHQLMVAQEEGQLHFVDLRAPSARPSLSRSVPLGDADAGGLYEADWSPIDLYQVGGVCGGRWLLWDLRFAGSASPPQHVGDAHPGGGTAFKFAPMTPRTFATAGTGGEVLVHTLAPATADVVVAGGAHPFHASHASWAPAPTRLGHDLPTRVAALSWLHAGDAMPMLAGAADSKVCLWAAGAQQGGAAVGALGGVEQQPMALM